MLKVKIIIITLFLIFVNFNFIFATEKADERFYIATKAFSDGFYDAAILLFQRFIEDFPQDTRSFDAQLYIAKCYYFKKDYQRSSEMFKELLKKPKEEFLDEVYYWMGELLYRGKNFKESLFYLDKIIENYPNSKFYLWAYYLKAINYLELNKEEQAKEFLEKVINEAREQELIDNSYSQLLNLFFQKKDYSQIIFWSTKYIEKYKQGSLLAKVHFYLGEAFYGKRELEKAILNYNKALQLTTNLEFLDLIYQSLSSILIEKNNFMEAKKYIEEIKNQELRIFSFGVFYFKMKDYNKALDYFNDFLNRFPNSKLISNVYLNKAELLYEMGRLNDAISTYHYILENLKPSLDILDKTHYGLAWCYLKMGEHKKAINEFKNTLKYTDNQIVKISSQIQIADTYQEAENYSQALDIYNEILKNYPNIIYADYIQFQIGMIYLKTARLEEAMMSLKNLQKNFPSSKLIPETQYYLAVGYFSAEDYHTAKNILEDFIKNYPQSNLLCKAYYLYGKCFFNEKEYNKAIEIFKLVKEKTSDSELKELAWIDIGNAYLNMGFSEKAKNVWEEFLNNFSDSQYIGGVILNLGGFYEKEGNYSQAEKYYKLVIENYSNSIWIDEALLSLGHLYWVREDLDNAIIYFRQLANSSVPLSIKAKFYLAKVYAQKNNFKEALELYDELINMSTEISKTAMLEKALLLKDLKAYEEAIELFNKLISLGFDSFKVRFSLGFCFEKINRNQDAINEYLNIIYRSKDNSYKIKAYFRIARIYEKENRIDLAKETYKKILDFGTKESKIAKLKLEALEKK